MFALRIHILVVHNDQRQPVYIRNGIVQVAKLGVERDHRGFWASSVATVKAVPARRQQLTCGAYREIELE